MKTHKLGISIITERESSSESFISYTLPEHERILDFYSSTDFTLLLSNTGELWEIGSFTQKNSNSFEYRSLELKLSLVSIACNGFCAILLTKTGRLYGWGFSNTGLLGLSSTSQTPSLLPNFEMKKINQICMSSSFACCVDDQGSLYIWGTFPYANLNSNLLQLTNYKEFSVKEVCCNDQCISICTDGGFVYYIGKIGVHDKNEVFEMTTFDQLEALCVIKIAAGQNFIAVLTDTFEVYTFDSCQVLNQLPTFEKIHNILSTNHVLLGFSQSYIHKWSASNENNEKYKKKSCWLKRFQGRVSKFINDIEIIKAKGMGNAYGIVAVCGVNEKFESKIVKSYQVGWNKGSFKKVFENDIENGLAVGRVLMNIIENAKRDAFLIMKEDGEQKIIMRKMMEYAKLPHAVANSYAKWRHRNIIAALQSIKEMIKMQDFKVNERVRKIRSSTILRNDVILKMLNILSTSLSCNLKIHKKHAFFLLKSQKNTYNIKLVSLANLIKISKSYKLYTLFKTWWVKAVGINKGLSILHNFIKYFKHKKSSEFFYNISCYSAYKKYDQQKKTDMLCQILKMLSHKYYRNLFNRWKAEYMKNKAQNSREFRNYKITVRLGCKFLFPVFYKYFCQYWMSFTSQSLKLIKTRYKHFALFLRYFIKKKNQSLKEHFFNRITGNSSRLPTENLENFSQSAVLSPKDDSMSMISSLNMMITSHKKILNSSAKYLKIPKLLLNLTPRDKSRFSSTQSTVRPPWKPASGCSSGVATPKAIKNNEFELHHNKCLRSLNILTQKQFPIKQKIKKQNSVENRIRVDVGLRTFSICKENIDFRLKFDAFSTLKFN
ncbi:hypothetical protein SteCoe_35486 [Stentor coeruleus]|uniref:Uncharacterized protein n=1 Tax=Stentor coeruleus TaxID=5963 RepID=A0A1R2ASA3_9CILI|nr:hypothetical protein SteCoe_35486 [Stentor coeruleus]